MNDLVKQQTVENIAAQLEAWIRLAPGEFRLRDVAEQFEFCQDGKCEPIPTTYGELTQALEKLVSLNIIEHASKRRGHYRPVVKRLEPIDYHHADDKPLPIWLPFGLSRYVQIMPGNIIIISGSPNAGKTAICLNLAIDNQEDFNVSYFSSEMAGGEMRKRLSKFRNSPLSAINFQAFARDGDFADVIMPGEKNINIIDFLEVHDNFWLVGQYIKDIHERLNGAVAVIAMQKNPGADTGLGGYRMMEKARLALTLEGGLMKVVKAKNYADPVVNPNGMSIKYKLFDGINLSSPKGWTNSKE